MERSSKRRKLGPIARNAEIIPTTAKPGRRTTTRSCSNSTDAKAIRHHQSPISESSGAEALGISSNDKGQVTRIDQEPEGDNEVIVVKQAPDGVREDHDVSIDAESIDDTLVRASGRRTRPPARRKQSTTPVQSKATRRKPTSARPGQKPQKVFESEASAGAIEEKGHPDEEKENAVPTSEYHTDALDLVVLRAQKALDLHDQTSAAVSSAQATVNATDLPSGSRLEDEGQEWTSSVLKDIQKTLLARATDARLREPVGLEDEYQKVQEIVNQAVETGESNSMILIGPRGSGKTMLVNHVLQAQRERYPDDFHVVRLNGFIHTDDKLALRDIWRQLGRDIEPDVDDDTIHSYADTLAMLLALLSDPEELGQSSRTGHMAKSVIFVLDEFDLFATHPRQTLLYNLFDIAQSRKAPIAVLGLTTRVDIVEALEKRVKSRFSHRYLHIGLAKNLSTFKQICASYLAVPLPEGLAASWEKVVNAIQAHDSYHRHVCKIYYRSKSVVDFLATLLIPLGSLPTETASVSQEIVNHIIYGLTTPILGPDSKLDLLSSLSSLQLALLISAARQSAIYNTDNVTFNLVYEEYKSLAGKAKLQATASGAMSAGGRILGKDVAKIAWLDLKELDLILEDGRGIGKVDIALEEIASSGVDLGQWGRWCREI